MKYSLLTTTVFLSLTAVSAFAAERAPKQGEWYGALTGDVSNPENSRVRGSSSGGLDYGFSSGGNLALGYQPEALSTNVGDVRAEIEVGYHALGVKSTTVNGATNAHANGDVKMLTGMANLYYDVHTHSSFTPYIGGGIGEARVDMRKSYGFNNRDGSDNVFAYQVMTGVAYTPESMPSTDWLLGYRYVGTEAPTFATDTGSVSLGSLADHNVEVGVRLHF